ncbi:MAG TPA: helix-turn-helix transcriptional regulator [Gemmatimonadaceae bacterium]|nr:helix-turn-helix transcriptional regulator [Gemmatimonadaceae bacterium]
MAEWIGRDLKRLRKLRGMRRQDVAAQLRQPVSVSTIRNIEHDEQYNVSLDLLGQIAQVLGADVRITLEPREVEAQARPEGVRRAVASDHFIHIIREQYPDCALTNSQIGRRMWGFASARGATRVRDRKLVKKALSWTGLKRAPTTAAEYEVSDGDMAALERYADRLGRAFKDDKGRILVPVA